MLFAVGEMGTGGPTVTLAGVYLLSYRQDSSRSNKHILLKLGN